MSAEQEHISEEELEAIERYMRGEMSNAERADFEQRMAEDDKLRQAATDYGMLMEGVETAALKSRLDDYHAEMEAAAASNKTESPAAQKKSRPIFKYLIAASVLLAVGLTTWLIAFQPSEEQQLFAAYFKPDPGLITPMSSTDRYEFYTGMIDYKRENYAEAIGKWEPLLENKPQSDTLNYFIGVAHLAMGDEAEALPYLQAGAEATESVFRDEAWYYLGLTYLKAENSKAAIEALRKSDDERAAELLAELEEANEKAGISYQEDLPKK